MVWEMQNLQLLPRWQKIMGTIGMIIRLGFSCNSGKTVLYLLGMPKKTRNPYMVGIRVCAYHIIQAFNALALQIGLHCRPLIIISGVNQHGMAALLD